MRYLEAADDAKWIAVSQQLGAIEPLDMVLFLYPGASDDDFPPPFQAGTADASLERVTTYEDDALPLCSSRIPVNSGLHATLKAAAGSFEDWGDNLTLYRPASGRWIASYIPHEQMLLLADDALEPVLSEAGMRFVETPPECW